MKSEEEIRKEIRFCEDRLDEESKKKNFWIANNIQGQINTLRWVLEEKEKSD